MGAQGWPRVSKMTPQILPKFVEKRGPGPGAHPKGAKGTPGPPKSQKSDDFLTFLVRTSEAQYQKKANNPSCFLHIFGRTIGGTVPKKDEQKRGEHSVLFFKHFW